MTSVDVVVIGAGAAGMMCAAQAGRRGRSVLVLDHLDKPGEKIRISGGGRCNFTNAQTSAKNFISANPHFCISVLQRYTPQNFIALVELHGIKWHEKKLGQLFCDDSAQQIIDMLLDEMKQARVDLRLRTHVESIEKGAGGFRLTTSCGQIDCQSLVVACGGKSIPKMGATGLGYDIARQFGIPIIEPRPALVPLTFEKRLLEQLRQLAGISVEGAVIAHGKTKFRESVLFTHRGLSGPAILQISSYWREGDDIIISLLPDTDVFNVLRDARAGNGRQALVTLLSTLLPRRLAQWIVKEADMDAGTLADLSDKKLRRIETAVNAWRVTPNGSEGYRTAEVTLGGVDTSALDQKTMQSRSVPGLYFIGEVVDVTGWLGGYNFQWAWASGFCAGQAA